MKSISTDKLLMKSAKSMSALYEIFERLSGPDHARESVVTAISSILWDIQEENLEVTPEIIEKRLELYVKDFIEVDKKNNAA